ncbi:Frag1/DRAM/Sfk1 family protein [Nitzschia inconspicua]|uniref:Frag1/DRAM/Sfk1 family protein n=1 Tax=Nitzschia inconspicua TaxID=303405 RepID=A0A9K3L5I5_9STRA|nr:Frag1/DRAM/Sfk1 family protein [Nitzschia inconspicua]
MVPPSDNCSVIEKISVTSCCIPLLGSCFGVGTILSVYLVTELPPGIHTPPISLLGCQQPEHTVYQLGFSVTGLLLGYCVLILFRNHFYLPIQEYSSLLALSSWIGGIMAVVGVTGQGVITLHPDFLQNIKPGGIGMTQQDRLHQQLALVFFVGAALHTYSTCWFAYRGIPRNEKMESDLFSNASPTTGSQISLPATQQLFSTTSRHLKTACVAVSLLAAPIAEMYHPTRLANDTGEDGIAPVNNKRIVNVIGLTQYVAVGAYIVFFGSYSLDLFQLRQRLLQQQQQVHTGKKKDE